MCITKVTYFAFTIHKCSKIVITSLKSAGKHNTMQIDFTLAARKVKLLLTMYNLQNILIYIEGLYIKSLTSVPPNELLIELVKMI